jgi:tetratricopeptide (TPR) repeat protein
VILKNVPKLAGLASLADVEDDQKEVKLREAFIVPGTTIWRFVSAAQARPVAERENVDIGKLRELLAQMGHDDVRADEIPAKLAEAFKAMQARGAEQVAPSNAGADIDATIAAARAKLRDSDPQGALALLKAKRAEETQARVKRETALLAEQAAVERLAYDYAGAKATLKELTQLDPDAVWRWIDLGELWRTTGNLTEASRAFGSALDAARRQGLARDEAAALERLGMVLIAQGRLAEALQSYQAQLAIADRLAQADPHSTIGHRDLSVSHNKIGAVLVQQGKLADALQAFRDGLALAERLVQADPDNAEWRRDLAVSNERVGDVLAEQGKLNEALQTFQAQLSIVDRLAQANPDNMERQRDLSLAYNKLGNVLAKEGKLDEALQYYRDSIAIRERLAQADPGNAQWRRDLSVSYNKIGDVLTKQGKLAEALQSYRGGLAITEHLAQADPDNAEWRRDLSVSCMKIARANPDEARVMLTTARDIAHRLRDEGKLAPRDAWMPEALARRLTALGDPAT